MSYYWIVLVTVVGCGRAGFDGRVPDAPGGSDADAPAPIDATSDADAPAPIDATITGPCTGTTLIDDPLDDASAAPFFSAQPAPGLTLVEGAGHLDVQFATTVSGGNFAAYRSATAFTAEGICATVEVSQTPGDLGLAFFKLRTAQLEVELLTSGGMIQLRTRQANNISVERMFPLDLIASRFWRIRQLAGTTYWETSPDGLAYTTHATLAGFFTATSCQVEIGAGAQATATSAGAARYERVVVVGP